MLMYLKRKDELIFKGQLQVAEEKNLEKNFGATTDQFILRHGLVFKVYI